MRQCVVALLGNVTYVLGLLLLAFECIAWTVRAPIGVIDHWKISLRGIVVPCLLGQSVSGTVPDHSGHLVAVRAATPCPCHQCAAAVCAAYVGNTRHHAPLEAHDDL